MRALAEAAELLNLEASGVGRETAGRRRARAEAGRATREEGQVAEPQHRQPAAHNNKAGALASQHVRMARP